MSLDVYLTLKEAHVSALGEHIYIREGGRTKEVTRAEWNERFPDREPFAVEINDDDTVYSANITHNLNKMAEAAAIYKELWRPDEIGITHAHQLIVILRAGLAILQGSPDYFKTFNPSNGWGTYEGFVEFVAGYLAACEAYPAAKVSVSR